MEVGEAELRASLKSVRTGPIEGGVKISPVTPINACIMYPIMFGSSASMARQKC